MLFANKRGNKNVICQQKRQQKIEIKIYVLTNTVFANKSANKISSSQMIC